MIKIGEKNFVKDEINKLKKIRYIEGITYEDFEKLTDGGKEYFLS